MIIHLKDLTSIISSPQTIWRITKDLLEAEDKIDQDKEHFWVFHLNCQNKINLIELVSLGTLNASIVHPREVFTRAVGERSANIIVVHNHPSGALDPSEEDIVITKRLAEAGKLLGIELMDHLIVTLTGFISFKEKELI